MSDAADHAVRVLISGRVQGVCFRYSTLEQAKAAALVGWVRNLPDGRVEAHLQGEPGSVESLLSWIRAGGPPAGRVTDIAVEPVPPIPARGFAVRS